MILGSSSLLASADDPDLYYRNEILPEKVRLNLEYARRATLLTDFAVILKTLARVLAR